MHAPPLPPTSLRFPIIIDGAGACVIMFWWETRYNHQRCLLLYLLYKEIGADAREITYYIGRLVQVRM